MRKISIKKNKIIVAILMFFVLISSVFLVRAFFQRSPIEVGCDNQYVDDNGLVWCIISTVRRGGEVYDFLITYETQRANSIIHNHTNNLVSWGITEMESTLGTTKEAQGPTIRDDVRLWASNNIPESLYNRIVHANIPIEDSAPSGGPAPGGGTYISTDRWTLTAFSTPIIGSEFAGNEGVFLPSASEINAMSGRRNYIRLYESSDGYSRRIGYDEWCSEVIGGLANERPAMFWIRTPGINDANPASAINTGPGGGQWRWWEASGNRLGIRSAMWVRR